MWSLLPAHRLSFPPFLSGVPVRVQEVGETALGRKDLGHLLLKKPESHLCTRPCAAVRGYKGGILLSRGLDSSQQLYSQGAWSLMEKESGVAVIGQWT